MKWLFLCAGLYRVPFVLNPLALCVCVIMLWLQGIRIQCCRNKVSNGFYEFIKQTINQPVHVDMWYE